MAPLSFQCDFEKRPVSPDQHHTGAIALRDDPFETGVLQGMVFRWAPQALFPWDRLDGPLGMAQDFRTPSTSRRKSIMEPAGVVLLDHEDRAADGSRPAPARLRGGGRNPVWPVVLQVFLGMVHHKT